MEAIIMPQIGQDLTTGVVLEWFKNEGDAVEKGEVVASVESEKAAFDVEAEKSGVLLKILVKAGEEGEVFKPIGYIGEEGEVFENGNSRKSIKSTDSEKASKEERILEIPVRESAAEKNIPAGKRAGKIFASPSARRVAEELGISLAEIDGTGPKGRIVKKDVLDQSFKRKPEQVSMSQVVQSQLDLEDKKVTFDKIGKIVAQRLTQSKQTIPHFYLYKEVDMEDAMVWREQYNRKHNTKITVTDMFVHAAAFTLKDFPRFNSHVYDEAVYYKKDINIGVATSTEKGLMVPVLARAGDLTIQEISSKIKQNAEDARRGKLALDVKGTFTVTSLGMFGIPSFLPIINPPECCILSIGVVEPRVVPVSGSYIGVRRTVTVALASDHRAVSGVDAARFLQRLNKVMIDLYGIA